MVMPSPPCGMCTIRCIEKWVVNHALTAPKCASGSGTISIAGSVGSGSCIHGHAVPGRLYQPQLHRTSWIIATAASKHVKKAHHDQNKIDPKHNAILNVHIPNRFHESRKFVSGSTCKDLISLQRSFSQARRALTSLALKNSKNVFKFS